MNHYILETVTAVLINQPETRDCDLKLMSVIYKGLTRGNDFFMMLESKQVPSPESIRRTRQKLQENYPHLRGEKYLARHKHQIKVKKDLGYPV